MKGTRGTVVAEFYKGKWSDKASDGKEALLFELTDAQDVVKTGNQLESLNVLITSKQKTKFNEAQVRYHSMTAAPKPGSPTHFTLKSTQTCYARRSAEP